MFEDRRQAGHRLAKRLLRCKDLRPVVLALPRGGVPVAVEIARELDAPLDLLLVRKIGAPWQRDLAVGAIVGGCTPQLVLNDALIAATGVPRDYISRESVRQLREIDRRRHLYVDGRDPLDLRERTVIIVDDVINTGASLRAAVRGVRLGGARTVVVAVAVADRKVVEQITAEVDDLVCLVIPEHHSEVAAYFRDAHQVHDDEVAVMLAEAGRRR